MTRKIAIYGGSFNPPTNGHKEVIIKLSNFEEIILVPSYKHAWGKQVISFHQRVEMLQLFIDDLNIDNLKISLIEESIFSSHNNFVTTYDVLNALQNKYVKDDLTFVIGPDNFYNFNKFYKHTSILEKWSILVIPEIIKIRSTLLRTKINEKQSIDDLTTNNVLKYIKNKNLFRKSE